MLTILPNDKKVNLIKEIEVIKQAEGRLQRVQMFYNLTILIVIIINNNDDNNNNNNNKNNKNNNN